jgi:putative acetyltransferase
MMIIRSEARGDAPSIGSVTQAAFDGLRHSSQTEAAIVDALRQAGVLSLSLVADSDGEIIGHIAFSPVLIDGENVGWFGLGPVSVLPEHQGKGVGSALIEQGLRQLQDFDANGCVLLGDPRYYGRFGFTSEHGLRYGTVPSHYFQSRVLHGERQTGEVTFHEAFQAG